MFRRDRPVGKVDYGGDPNDIYIAPLDMSDLYPDEQDQATVNLVVYFTFYGSESRDMHWAVSWDVPTDRSPHTFHRYVSLHPFNGVDHLVYFGAKTKIAHETPCRKFSLGDLSKAARDRLEYVADRVDVYYPATNGGWNSQDWVEDLLLQAARNKILDKKVVEDALVVAKNVCYP